MYKVHRAHLDLGISKKFRVTQSETVMANPIGFSTTRRDQKRSLNLRRLIKIMYSATPHLRHSTTLTLLRQASTSNTNDAEAQEIAADFQKRFHKVEHPIPQLKELKLAAEVIRKHGMEMARHFVRFSHQIAQETNYQPQNFSGIMQYEARAVADFDAHKKRGSRKQQLLPAHCATALGC